MANLTQLLRSKKRYYGMTPVQLGFLGLLVVIMCMVWMAMLYVVVSSTTQAFTNQGNGADTKTTPSLVPTWTPTPHPTPLPTPGPLGTDTCWTTFQGLLQSLRTHDVEGVNAIIMDPLDSRLCADDPPEKECTDMMDLMYTLYGNVVNMQQTDFTQIWTDENQLIMVSEPVIDADVSDGRVTVTYTDVIIYFYQDHEGRIKVILVEQRVVNASGLEKDQAQLESSLYTRMRDRDQDGLTDEDELCQWRDEATCKVTDPTNKDSDKDGLWDGIEVAGETDPNNQSSRLP